MSRYDGRLPMDYQRAEAMLDGKMSKKVLNNTTLEQIATNRIAVKYFGNTIAVFQKDGLTALTTCGWETASTHERLNAMTNRVRFHVVGGVGYVTQGRVSFRSRETTVVIGSDRVSYVEGDSIHDALTNYTSSIKNI